MRRSPPFSGLREKLVDKLICAFQEYVPAGGATISHFTPGPRGENPVAYLDGLNVKEDRRHDRRALRAEELAKLLKTTAAEPRRYKLSGRSRATLYRVAMETGL